MKLPKVLGKLSYYFSYPILRLLIKGTTRAYVLIIVNDEVLLVKGWLGSQNKWHLPGGGLNRRERPNIAAQRELKEEVGIDISTADLVTLNEEPLRTKLGYNYYLFTLNLPQKPNLSINNIEILEAVFVPIITLATLQLNEELKYFVNLAKKEFI